MRPLAVLLTVVAVVTAAAVVGSFGVTAEEAEAAAVDVRRADVPAAELHRGGPDRRQDLRGRGHGGGDRASASALRGLRPRVRLVEHPAEDARGRRARPRRPSATSSTSSAVRPTTGTASAPSTRTTRRPGAGASAPPLPEARFNHAAVTVGDGKIYVLGGYLEGQERDDVFVYDPATDQWSEGPPLPFTNHAFGPSSTRTRSG